MEKVALLSHLSRRVGGLTYLYPIFRWERLLRENQLHFDLFTNHADKRILNYKTVIIIHRYFESLINNGVITSREYVKEYLDKLKRNGARIIFFDAGDSTGSDSFDMMDFVDIFLKKQLLRDKTMYLGNNGSYKMRVWLPDEAGNSGREIEPCKPENLSKLKLAWNIGLADYRYNPLKIGLVSNYLFTQLKTNKPSLTRKYLTAFRGTIHNNNDYAIQRNAIARQLNESTFPIIIGKPVNRWKYLREIWKCKAIISPYGWGEICYRDFEAFIQGAVLIKPDMSHLETFPDFFLPDQTYLPINWQISDLEERLIMIDKNYEEFIEIANCGQREFLRQYNDGEQFVNQINNFISSGF